MFIFKLSSESNHSFSFHQCLLSYPNHHNKLTWHLLISVSRRMIPPTIQCHWHKVIGEALKMWRLHYHQ